MARNPKKIRPVREQWPWSNPGSRNEELIIEYANDVLRTLEDIKLEAELFNFDDAVSGDIFVASGSSGHIVFEPQKYVPKLGIGTSGDPTWNFEVSGGTLHAFLRDTTFGGFRGLWIDRLASEVQRVGLRIASGGVSHWEVSESSGATFQIRWTPTGTDYFTISSGGTNGAVSGDFLCASSIICSGSPEASSTRSRIQLGNPVNIGNANGTYLSINSPSGFAGTHFLVQLNGDERVRIDDVGQLILRETNAGHQTGANGIDMLTVASGLGVGIRMANADTGASNPWQIYTKGNDGSFVLGRAGLRDNFLCRMASAGVYIPPENAGASPPTGNYLLYVGPSSGYVQADASGNIFAVGNISSSGQVSGVSCAFGSSSGFAVNSTGQFAFSGKAVGGPQTYSVTNSLTDRTYDANATTIDEIADVLATLISDLRDKGIVA